MQLAPNPLYVALVVAVAALVVEAHAGDGPLAAAFPVLVVAGLAFAALRVVLAVATTHGAGAVLVELPRLRLPTLLGGFTVGGTVEAPVLARAAAEGWALVGILAAFGAFNAVVSHRELVQAAPRAFYEVGLAVVVALSFVPSTVAAVAAVRQADAARTGGRVVRRGRLLRQLVPILETGMERAVALAESMDSRGFGHRRPGPGELASAGLNLAALLALGSGVLALVGGSPAVAAALAAGGAAGLGAAVLVASRAVSRTRYRPRRLRPGDWGLAVLAVAAPLALAALSARGDPSLAWPGPGPGLGLPGLNVVAVAALALLATPALVPSAAASPGLSEPVGRAGPERPSERGAPGEPVGRAGPERPSERGAPSEPVGRAGPERPSDR